IAQHHSVLFVGGRRVKPDSSRQKLSFGGRDPRLRNFCLRCDISGQKSLSTAP
ncbi:hypothetical protein TorRG33x02_349330, partial [Trema orientale]